MHQNQFVNNVVLVAIQYFLQMASKGTSVQVLINSNRIIHYLAF
jgi:hypothetical protein